jgi:hypothetical protein
MKLVEVVILTGLQCVSPTQNTSLSTEVSKVWCAVIVESDAQAKTIAVTPRSQVDHPMVKSVLTRIALAWTPPDKRVLLQSGLKVIDPTPTAAPASAQAAPGAQTFKSATMIAKTPAALPEAETPVPTASTEDVPDAVGDGASPEDTAAAIDETPAPKTQTAALATEAEPPAKKPAKRTGKKRSDVCRSGTKAVWYTNSEGRKKYRCRKLSDLKIY